MKKQEEVHILSNGDWVRSGYLCTISEMCRDIGQGWGCKCDKNCFTVEFKNALTADDDGVKPVTPRSNLVPPLGGTRYSVVLINICQRTQGC